jgi:intraflagellar transport protein 56
MDNQMSLAAIHYLRSNYADAIDIYNRMQQQHPDFLALHVYVGMCQFKLDQFEASNESVDQYLAQNSDSAVGLNLKACDYLRMFDADIAQSQILQIRKFSSASYSFIDALVEHNLVVFHNGEDGFTVLPRLVGSLPEARFNLALLYMRDNNPTEAYNLLQRYQPLETTEVILRATVWLAYGQLTQEGALLAEANHTFADIGEMETIRDTVPGRQCLATTKFIMSEYNETLRILQSIEQQAGETDEFNYNKAMSLALLSRWAEAERYFLLVKNPQYTKEIFYTSWLCRCYIKNKKPANAWNLYVEATQTEDAKTLLQIIGPDCYASGAFYSAMRAYDVLAKSEGDPVSGRG